MKKLFERIGKEEANTEVVAKLSVEEMIIAEEEAAEFDELSTEIEDDISTVEEAEEVIGSLEEQVDADEAKLAEPETIAATDAMVSQEALVACAASLGYDMDSTISVEAANDEPVTALTLSVEGAKEFVAKAIAMIKELVKKAIVSIKKLITKAVVYFSTVKKQADNFKEEFAKKTVLKKDAAITDGDVKKIESNLGCVFVAANDGWSQLLDMVNISTSITGFAAKLESAEGLLKTAMTSGTVDDHKAYYLQGVLPAILGLNPKATYITTAIEADKFEPKLEAGYTATVLRADGKSVKCILTKDVKLNEVKTVADVYARGYKMAEFKMKPKTLKAADFKIASIGDINMMLNKVATVAGNSDKFSKDVLTAVGKNEKLLTNLESLVKKEEEVNASDKTAVTSLAGVAKIGAVNVALDMILGNIAATKAVLRYAVLHASKYEAPAK